MSTTICNSRQEVDSLISEIQNITHTKYVCERGQSSYVSEDWQPSEKSNIFFQKNGTGKTPTIPFIGTPFMVIGHRYFGCHQGKDKTKTTKKRRAEQRMKAGDQNCKKRRYLIQNTKKVDCPAVLTVTRVATFLDKKFQVNKNIRWVRAKMSNLLKLALSKKEKVTWENRYFVYLSNVEDHAGHSIIREVASIHEEVDPRVKERIKELTNKCQVTSVAQMQTLIKDFVTNTILKGEAPPPRLHRKYFPLDRDVQDIMMRVQDVSKYSSDDQENLHILIQGWREKDPEDNIFLRTHKTDQAFLLCYQTKWQRRLLHLYGQDFCLIDASYKVTSFALAQYFLFVRTNVCYVVAAVFFVQQETMEAVSEALYMLKHWNKGWSPGHFMVDFNESQINAVESVFPDSKAVLCRFHCEKAWEEWIEKLSNGIQNKDVALSLLRRIASSNTMEKYQQAVKKLQDSEEWKNNTLFQQWFLSNWMTEVERWVTVFQEEILLLNITANNGVERLNETFKYSHRNSQKTSTISEMMSIIVNDFTPSLHKKYSQLNIKFSSRYKKYNSTVPSFLHNRPRDMVKYIIQGYNVNTGSEHVTKITDVNTGSEHVTKMTDVNTGSEHVTKITDVDTGSEHVTKITDVNTGSEHVTKITDLRFQVRSETDRTSYQVSLGSMSEDSLPSCSCSDWKRNKLPCKHFCAVFKAGWTWDHLCPKYRDNPLFMLDPICITCSSIEHPAKKTKNRTSYMHRQDEEGDDGSNSPSEEIEDDDDDDLPVRKKAKTDINELRRRAIEHQKTISNLLYLLQDEKCMEAVDASLENLKNFIEARVPQKAGITLNDLPNPNQSMATEAATLPASEDDQVLTVEQSHVGDLLNKSEQRTSEDGGHITIKIYSAKKNVRKVS